MSNKHSIYTLVHAQFDALTEGCALPLPALANCAALLWQSLPDVNWVGFYMLKGDTLYLGPFQGKLACTVIPVGKGVCGTAARTRQIQVVKDVHQFAGHIACDSASNSEIVLPLLKDGALYGVMDIDSPLPSRFDDEDAEGLRELCDHLMKNLDWSGGLLG